MDRKFWRIRGYNSSVEFFDVSIPINCITENQLKEMLKCLVAKEGLSYREVVGGYVKRKATQAHDLLCVNKEGLFPRYYCGTDPHFSAVVVDVNGNGIKYPALEN